MAKLPPRFFRIPYKTSRMMKMTPDISKKL